MPSVLYKIFVVIFIVLSSICSSNAFDYGFKNHRGDEQPQGASLSTLRFVAIVARHGSRSPVATYPNDPYPFNDRRFWPQGKGELTNLGKKQLFSLGKQLRERYDGFLSETYYPNDTINVYNPNNRDFESLACLLAGLYPPVGNQIWDEDLLWQPIPTHVYAFDICELLHNNDCPAFKIEALKMAALYGAKLAFNTSYLLKFLTNHTGQHFFTVLQLHNIMDPLLRQEENGFKLPEWTKAVNFTELEVIYCNTLNALFAGSNRILSLSSGPELEHLTELFNGRVNGSLSNNTRMYIELAHDCTLYSLLKAIGSSLGHQLVETSAHLVFELHELYDTYIIQAIYYRNYEDEHPSLVNMEACPSPCSLENFNKFVARLTGPESWKDSCKRVSLL